MKSGPIILIDDDADDKEVFLDILKELQVPNPVVWFQNCEEALTYLKVTTEQPFLIFCDLNLPGLPGIEFKRQVDRGKEFTITSTDLFLAISFMGTYTYRKI